MTAAQETRIGYALIVFSLALIFSCVMQAIVTQ